MAWAAAWLAKATGESGYLETARELFDEGGLCTWVPTGFDWDSKTVGVYVLMYELTNEDRSVRAFLPLGISVVEHDFSPKIDIILPLI